MTEQARERRRILIVNRPVQRRIVAAVVLAPTAALALTTVVVAYYCQRLVEEATLVDVALPSLSPLLWSVLGFCVVCSLVIVIRGLRFSHHVAGPAYRLCKSLERIRAGDTAFRVKLRDGDYLGEIADEMNRLLESMQAAARTATSAGAGDAANAERTAEQPREDARATPAMATAGAREEPGFS